MQATSQSLAKGISTSSSFTPRHIVEELNKYIIGQDAAKKSVAIALRNRWRRQQVSPEMREEIMPNNIIMIGPTGVGKTEIARRLAKLSGAPFVKVEATKYTEVGYVGRDVESMIRDLVDISVAMVRAEKTEEVQAAAKKSAENRLLDLILPSVTSGGFSFDDSDEKIEHNTEARDEMRRALSAGELEDKLVELENSSDTGANVHVMGPIGMEEFGVNFQEMLSPLLPRRNKKRSMTVAEARLVLQSEESSKMIDMEAVAREALRRVETMGIVFIDEIDKIAAGTSGQGGGGNADVSRSGVQRDLLPVVEGSTISTKYGTIKTDHILFIASGAFHVAKPSDLIPELQGRFPIRVELQSLTEADFVKILTIPENALIKQYAALLASDGVEVHFTEDAICEIAKTAALVNDEVVNIGARRLHTILSTLLEDILFNAPDNLESMTLTITSETVKERLTTIVKNQDLTKYIL